MEKTNPKNFYISYVLAWLGVFTFRFALLAWRAPNVEPILATTMPFAKLGGIWSSALFGFTSIVLYDAVTSGWGIWTAITAIAYALVSVGAHLYFKNREATRMNFLKYGIMGTLFYDAATGLVIGPVFQGQSFALALAGQIPFTALHLLGTVIFATLLSPALYTMLKKMEAKEMAVETQRA
jgi:hypothetical protein